MYQSPVQQQQQMWQLPTQQPWQQQQTLQSAAPQNMQPPMHYPQQPQPQPQMATPLPPRTIVQAWGGNAVNGAASAGGAPTVIQMSISRPADWHDHFLNDCCRSAPLCWMSWLWCIVPWRWALTLTRAGIRSNIFTLCTSYMVPTYLIMIFFFLYISDPSQYGAIFGVAWIFWAIMVGLAGCGRTRLRMIYGIPGTCVMCSSL
jgi:hypothetical protein